MDIGHSKRSVGAGGRSTSPTQEMAVAVAPLVVMLRQDGSSTGSLLGWVRCRGRGGSATEDPTRQQHLDDERQA